MTNTDHIDGMFQRFDTPTKGDPFEEAFFGWARYCGKRVDRQVMERYRRILVYRDENGVSRGIPVNQLEAVVDSIFGDPSFKKSFGIPDAGDIKRRWRDRKSIQQQKAEEQRKAKEPPVPRDESKAEEVFVALRELFQSKTLPPEVATPERPPVAVAPQSEEDLLQAKRDAVAALMAKEIKE